jgi:beta-glucosidase
MAILPGAVHGATTETVKSDSRIEARVENLLKQMTLEEKIDYIGGYKDFYIRPVERLGLPQIKMSDGPVGVRNYGPTTAYPAGIALAASWNADLAGEYGECIGRDARARGVHIWLGPGVNIFRASQCGRNFEYFGEDPYLSSCIAVPLIQGVQAQGVAATIKHYACNNQEYERHHISSNVDERTLREIYLPTFRAAAMQARVECVMNSYNLVNGVHATQNHFLNVEFLKQECGFDGVLMSDWAATYDGVEAANNGLDLEMPSAKFMNREALLPAIKSGKVSESTIDDKVRRILRMIVRMDWMDRPQEDSTIPREDERSSSVALEIARQGIVLLKNENKLLPLDKSALHRIAVIGPNAGPDVPAGGGSSHTKAFHQVSTLEGIKALAGNEVEVVYDAGLGSDSVATIAQKSFYEHSESDGSTSEGLLAEYFQGKKFSGKPVLARVEQVINNDWGKGTPEGVNSADKFSVRWTGRIRPKTTGDYAFITEADDGVRIFIDDKAVLRDWSDHAARKKQAVRHLKAGKTYDLRVEYFEAEGDAVARFGWQLVPDVNKSKAVQIAKSADVAILCVGFNSVLEGEGFDRTFELPAGQDALIRAVASANNHTIVLLNSGGNVDMQKWIDGVPALLHAWYPGQEGGTALAEILFGITNPSGHLPATFEKHWEDNPVHNSFYSTDEKSVDYSEGVFVGYRGYDQKRIEPQFCFGQGLSYTSFEFAKLELEKSNDEHSSVTVRFTVRNSGSRAGAVVAQCYVHDKKSSVPRPPKELKGFEKVFLNPGEVKPVEIKLAADAFSFWSEKDHSWKLEPGAFEILIGASSRDIRLSEEIKL